MRVGLDFDNTIACYDDVFRTIVDDMDIVPVDTPKNKTAIRDFLRTENREDEWTALQGYVYGDGMEHARPFPGAREFISRCRAAEVDVYIVSHRTRHPYAGPKTDLHAAARTWLEDHDIVSGAEGALSHDLIHFEVTKADKLARIAACDCQWFVDDLPEFLSEPGFPANAQRILFDPHRIHRQTGHVSGLLVCDSWGQIAGEVLGQDEVR